MATSAVSVALQARVSGPLFDGVADRVVARVVHDAADQLAHAAQSQVRSAAAGFDRSGRGHGAGGAAAQGVIISERRASFLVYGRRDPGVVWWPWLEGSTERNRTTRFKGYHTFRAARARADQDAVPVLQRVLADHIGEMGG